MAEPEWQRETEVMSSIALQPDLLAAIRAHAEAGDLGPVEARSLVCFQTVSRHLKRAGLLMRLAGAAHKVITNAVIVTPTRFVWATRLDDEEAFASSELLARLDIGDYEKGPGYRLIPDHGIEVHGLNAGQGHTGTQFFGLGEGPDADHARQVVKDAVRAAHGEGPPVVSGTDGSPSEVAGPQDGHETGEAVQ